MEDLKVIISRRRSRRLCCKELNLRFVDLEIMLYWFEVNLRFMCVVCDVFDLCVYLFFWVGV